MVVKKYVWEFTNQRKLEKKEFISYFEKKVFKTIRQYNMLPRNKVFTLNAGNDLNTRILKKILESKFTVKFSKHPNSSSENLSDVSEGVFENLFEGKFKGAMPKDKVSRPLYYISDKEIAVYAECFGIKGKMSKRDEKVQSLFEKFLKTNQDLELNVVKALGQIKGK